MGSGDLLWAQTCLALLRLLLLLSHGGYNQGKKYAFKFSEDIGFNASQE